MRFTCCSCLGETHLLVGPHLLTTYNSCKGTSVQRAPTAITLFPLSTTATTLSLEKCTSSRHTFPLTKAAEFIYVSTRNTSIGGKTFMRVLPVSPFSPRDVPGTSRYPHPAGGPCILYTMYTHTCFYNAVIRVPAGLNESRPTAVDLAHPTILGINRRF